MILVLIEHDRGALHAGSLQALRFARQLPGAPTEVAAHRVIGVVLGAGSGFAEIAATAAAYGADKVIDVASGPLDEYGPETHGSALASVIGELSPSAVVACGTDRGNEVLAQASARLNLAFVANALSVSNAESVSNADHAADPGHAADAWSVLRVRWGGSLHELTALSAPTKIVSVAPHTTEAEPSPCELQTERIDLNVDPALARTNIVQRVEREAGVTLATAPVVIGGGRGVGSAEGFAPLEDLAAQLGGVVGCSRAVTNNGWRNHSDQVGQTGTRIAPTVYIAAGISGAIQHWVGAMASKSIIAINTDPDANMVTKADFAVIGDLHEVIPAITAEILARRKEAS